MIEQLINSLKKTINKHIDCCVIQINKNLKVVYKSVTSYEVNIKLLFNYQFSYYDFSEYSSKHNVNELLINLSESVFAVYKFFSFVSNMFNL